MMAVGHVEVRNLRERGDQRRRIRRAPHRVAHTVGGDGGQQRFAADRAGQQRAQVGSAAEGEQYRLRMGVQGAHEAHAVVLLCGARALVRADQSGVVVGGAHAGGDAGLPVGAVLHPVEVERRRWFPHQDAPLLQADQVAARARVDLRVAGVDVVGQVYLGPHHAQEVASVAARHGGGFGAGRHVERRRDDRLRLVRRGQPWPERDDDHGPGP